MNISKKRIKELQKINDDDIDYSDIEPLDASFWQDAKLVCAPKKKPITLRIDEDIIAFYKTNSNSNYGYQTFMHDVLRTYVEAHKND